MKTTIVEDGWNGVLIARIIEVDGDDDRLDEILVINKRKAQAIMSQLDYIKKLANETGEKHEIR